MGFTPNIFLQSAVKADHLRQKAVWLLFLAFCFLAVGLGLRDPQPADEPRFALIAKDMVEQGHWFFPHRGQELYADKPPLFMWIQAGVYWVVRSWRIAFLLPSLLAALGTLICTYDLSRRLWTRRIACVAVVTLLLTFQFTYQSKRAQIDALLLFLMTFANYALLRHLLLGESWRWWVIGWCAAGLGTLCKGVGFLSLLLLIPAAVASVSGWSQRKLGVKKWQFWLGPLGFFLTVSLWLVPLCILVQRANRPEYYQYLYEILFHQTAQRYAHSWDHAQGHFYFLKVILIYWLPSALALPWAIPAWYRRLRRHDCRYWLPLAWAVSVLVFFSIPSGKRDMYVLPALPMLCLSIAPLIPGILRQRSGRYVLNGFAVLLTALFFLVGVAVIAFPSVQAHVMEDRGLRIGTVRWIGACLLSVAAIGAYSYAKLAKNAAHLPVIILILSGWILASLVFFPVINDASSSRQVMEAVGRHIGPADQLGLVGWKEQNLLMADRPTATFGFVVPWDVQLQRGIAWQAQRPAQRWLLIQEPVMASCIDRRKSSMIGTSNRRRWWLVPSRAINQPCQLDATGRAQARRDQTE